MFFDHLFQLCGWPFLRVEICPKYKKRSVVEQNLKLKEANAGLFIRNARKKIKFQVEMNQQYCILTSVLITT